MAYATAGLTSKLSLFDNAVNWKSYWAEFVRPYIRGRVLEVGAGSGGSIPLLVGNATDWLCLEPDLTLAARLQDKINTGVLPPCCRLEPITLQDLAPDQQFDAILYIDVMEHLSDHCGEARIATERLAPGGALIILSPAYQFLFSPFDEAVGHFRRYNRRSLRAIVPNSLELIKLIYLDSGGILLSLGNRLVLRSVLPSEGSLRFWNDWVIPISRRIDHLCGYNFGKSILGIWRKPVAR